MITQERLKELLSYCPDTGLFTWLERPLSEFKRPQDYMRWHTLFCGKAAGSIHPKGYVVISVDHRTEYAHRLVCLYEYNELPENTDHINGIKHDNRKSNIRMVTPFENHKNRKLPKNNTSGIIGVHWGSSVNKWIAQISAPDKRLCLGHFDDFFEACCVRKSSELKIGFHENHGTIRPL